MNLGSKGTGHNFRYFWIKDQRWKWFQCAIYFRGRFIARTIVSEDASIALGLNYLRPESMQILDEIYCLCNDDYEQTVMYYYHQLVLRNTIGSSKCLSNKTFINCGSSCYGEDLIDCL